MPKTKKPILKEKPTGISEVLIAIPTLGDINATTVSRLIRWGKNFPYAKVHFYFTHRVSPVDRARNQLVDFFMKNEKLTHIFFVDADTVPPYDALEKLLAWDKEIVTGMTPMLMLDKETNTWGTFFNCFSSIKDKKGKFLRTECPHPNTGLREVDRCGGSCLLIKKEVFKNMDTPYFQFIINPNGIHHIKSEDIYFCDTAREKGYTVWCDTSVVCKHYKSVMLG